MQTYETIFIAVPTLTDDEESAIVAGTSEVITQAGGVIAASDRMGRRRMAYPIQKHNDGVYVRFLYDSEADVPRELERRFRLSDKVLRSLTVRMEPDWAAWSKEDAVRQEQSRREAAERERELEEQRAREAAAAAESSDGADADVTAAGKTAGETGAGSREEQR